LDLTRLERCCSLFLRGGGLLSRSIDSAIENALDVLVVAVSAFLFCAEICMIRLIKFEDQRPLSFE